MGANQQALLMASGASGSNPIDVSGLTFWLDATTPALLYQTSGGSFVSADGDTVGLAQDSGGRARCMAQSTSGARPTYKTGIIGGKSVLRFDGTADYLIYQGTSSPGTSSGSMLALSDIASASAFTAIFAVSISSARAAQAQVFDNDALFRDQTGYLGLMVSLSAGTVTFHAYNWDGNADSATVTGTQSTWHIVSMRHGSGSLDIRIDGGSWSSTTSGDTTNLTFSPEISRGVAPHAFDLAHAAFWNAALSDGDVEAVEDYFSAQLGI